jgi:hypothetical protein
MYTFPNLRARFKLTLLLYLTRVNSTNRIANFFNEVATASYVLSLCMSIIVL